MQNKIYVIDSGGIFQLPSALQSILLVSNELTLLGE